MILDKNPNKILSFFYSGWKNSVLIFATLTMLGQCTSNASLTKKVNELSSRDVIVQVGSDRQVMVGKRINEVENREQFISELFSSLSWVKNTSAEYQEKCKAIAKENKNIPLYKQCASGIDPGANTDYGIFPSQIYAYQHLIAPEASQAIMSWILSLKPKGYESPQNQDSRTLRITEFGQAEPFTDGKNGKEMKTPATIEFTESRGAIITRKFKKYYWIYTRETLTPAKAGAKTPYSEAADATQRRGLYLTRIRPYQN